MNMPLMTEDQDQDSPTFEGSLPDGLFDDPNSALPQPDNPIAAAAIARKLDEASLTGACQKIAWGNNGSIAEIAKDGRTINIRSFMRPPGKNQFELSDPYKLELPPRNFDFPATHLSWSSVGSVPVLAVAGSTGSIVLCSSVHSCNRPRPVAFVANPGNGHNSRCVVIHWLKNTKSINSSTTVVRSTFRSEDSWNCRRASEKVFGVHSPHNNVQAFLTVTEDHAVQLNYHFYGLKQNWTSESKPLEHSAVFKERLTHASFGPWKDNSNLLATLDTSLVLRLYDITIQWNLPSEQVNSVPADFQLKASLTATFLKKTKRFAPEMAGGSRSFVKACHLHCLAPAPDSIEMPNKQPMILATYSVVNPLQAPSASPSYSSKLVACSVNEATEHLHESFKELVNFNSAGKSGKIIKRSIISLSDFTDLDISGSILNVEPHQADTLVALLKADGSSELFDRSICKIMEVDVTSDIIRHPLNAAYSFPSEDKLATDACLSPNGCMIARQDIDGQVMLQRMERLVHASDDRALAGLTMLLANSTMLNIANDDLLDHQLDLRGVYAPIDILVEYFKTIPVNFDFIAGEPQAKVNSFVMNPNITKSLGVVEAVLSDKSPRSVPSKVASTVLELRSIIASVYMCLGILSDQSATEDFAISVSGLVQWSIDLISFLIDEVLNMQRWLGANPALSQIQAEMDSRGTPTICLLLNSSSRMLLRTMSRVIRSFLDRIAGIAAQIAPSQRYWWLRIISMINDSPVNIFAFETFLGGLMHYAKEGYDGAGATVSDRATSERTFLLTGNIPAPLEELAKRLFGHSTDRLISEKGSVNQARVFKTDYRHLNVLDDVQTQRWWKGRRYCAFRKMDMAPAMTQWRRCTRCERVTEDVGQSQNVPIWLQRLWRSCPCGNGFLSVEG